MRDDSYLETEVETESSPSEWRAGAVTAIGAFMSVVILLAVVVWSYRLGVQDATEIPVIRAELEATKTRPADPGGLEVAHQDRAVYGVVSGQSGGEAVAGLADAPERLASEDVAPIAVSPEPAPAPRNAERAVAAPVPIEAASEVDAALDAPAPVETALSAPAATSASDEAIQTAIDGNAATETSEISSEAELSYAPRIAPVALRRPDRRAAAAAPAAESQETRIAAAASSIQIQLGAFISEALAAEQWTEIKARNGDILGGRGRVITTVQSGGRTLYRLRAGPFASVGEASSLCRGLKARNEACIVARAR